MTSSEPPDPPSIVKGSFLHPRPAERLLLSVIDANPDAGMDVTSARWLKRRQVRLKKALKQLFGWTGSAKGEQEISDQAALWWMASERRRDAFNQRLFVGKHPFARLSSYKAYIEKLGPKYKPRSDRKLNDQAAEKFYGPFDGVSADKYKAGHYERLRKKWRKQRGHWKDDVRDNDDVDDSIEGDELERCWASLEKLDITIVRNDLTGTPVKTQKEQ